MSDYCFLFNALNSQEKGAIATKIHIAKETTRVLSAIITKITKVHHMKGLDILDNSEQDSIALDFTI